MFRIHHHVFMSEESVPEYMISKVVEYRVSSRGLPSIDDSVEFLAAARRKQCYHFEAVFVRSFLDCGSYLHGVALSRVSSSRLLLIDDFC